MVVSKRLKRCLEAAREHAVARRHAWIGAEHLLLSMLDDQHGWPVELFNRLGVLEPLRAELTGFLDAPEHRWIADSTSVMAPMPVMNPRLLRTIQRAAEFGTDGITSEHALLAIVNDDRSVCSDILAELGVRDAVERETGALISSEDYFSGVCMLTDEHDRFLGFPEVQGSELFLRRISGRLMRPEDA